MKNICVFCASKTGNDPAFSTIAEETGKEIASRNKRLIYGGGNIGLMGKVANSVLDHGGEIVGIIPDFLLKREVGHIEATELVIVQDMMERKVEMINRSNAFIALPGGFGTLDEVLEVITWNQLHLIDKPLVIVNHNGYFDPLLDMIEKMEAAGFIWKSTKGHLMVAPDINETFTYLR